MRKNIPRTITLLHGTNQFFDKVDFNKLGRTDQGFIGKGFYLTEFDWLAYAYATGSASLHGGTETILKVTVKPKKTLEMEGTGADSLSTALENIGLRWEGDSNKVSQQLKKKGYDSVAAWYKGKIKEFVVLDPKIIGKIERK